MIIIGEKINGAVPKTGEAIKNRDEEYILQLVRDQEAAGADYLDVCAGSGTSEELEILCWLIDIIQTINTKPLCIDSPDPKILKKVFPRVKMPGIINSISGEGNKCEVLLPILQEYKDWQVIALCCDSKGIAESAESKTEIAFDLIARAGDFGIAPDRIHVDPLVLSLSAVNNSSVEFCKSIASIKAKYPTINIAAALSNISFGMPARALINRNFLTLIMSAGLDTIIADPTNREVFGTIFATEALLGKDRFCRKYNKAYREGRIGPLKN